MRVRLSVMVVAAAVAAMPPAAFAESVLTGGTPGPDGHTLGWPVYDASGRLAFATCDGKTQPLAEGGSFQATDERCPSRPAPFTLKGQVSAIAPERSRLELKDQSGAVHMLYLSAGAAQELAKLPPDARIEVEGPVPGYVDKVQPASS